MTPLDFILSLVIWTGGAIALAKPVAYLLNRAEEKWQQLEETRIVLRFDRKWR